MYDMWTQISINCLFRPKPPRQKKGKKAKKLGGKKMSSSSRYHKTAVGYRKNNTQMMKLRQVKSNCCWFHMTPQRHGYLILSNTCCLVSHLRWEGPRCEHRRWGKELECETQKWEEGMLVWLKPCLWLASTHTLTLSIERLSKQIKYFKKTSDAMEFPKVKVV